MKNSINVRVEFDFKGESYSPSATIDLDKLAASDSSFPSIYSILAGVNGIDTYSYMFEAMQEADVVYDHPQGLAAEFLIDGEFDHEAFVTRWRANNVLQLLQPIASRELGVDDLAQNVALKNALIQAYELGKQSGRAPG